MKFKNKTGPDSDGCEGQGRKCGLALRPRREPKPMEKMMEGNFKFYLIR